MTNHDPAPANPSAPVSSITGAGSLDRRKDFVTRAKFQELRAGIWSRSDLTQRQKERLDEEIRLYFGGGITSDELRDMIDDLIHGPRQTVTRELTEGAEHERA